MSENSANNPWSEHLSRPDSAERLAVEVQDLAKLLRRVNRVVNQRREPAIYRPASPVGLEGVELSGMVQTLPLLPVAKLEGQQSDQWLLAKVKIYSYGSGLIEPLAYEIYAAWTDQTLEDIWHQQTNHPEVDLTCYDETKLATVALAVTGDRPDDGLPALYQAFDDSGRGLELEDISTLSNLAGLYLKRVENGVDVGYKKFSKFYEISDTQKPESASAAK